MVKQIILLILLITSFLLISKPEDKRLFMSPHVSQFVKEIGGSYNRESIACLEYIEFLGDVYVYNYHINKAISMETTSATFYPCTTEEIPFHNHPYHYIDTHYELNEYYEQSTGDELNDPNQMVYISGQDYRFVIGLSYKYAVVSSNGHWGWWTREQIVIARNKGYGLLKPIKNQSTLPTEYEIEL